MDSCATAPYGGPAAEYGVAMKQFGIGQPVRRVEDRRFLTGRGHYLDDIVRPRQAHAVMLRSPHAHTRIRPDRLGPGALCRRHRRHGRRGDRRRSARRGPAAMA